MEIEMVEYPNCKNRIGIMINGEIVDAEIIETHDGKGNYTGKYCLIGIPGDCIDLPGKGGLITQKAARRAVETFENGGTYGDAKIAAWIY